MTGTTKSLTETRLNEPIDGVRRRMRRRKKSRKLIDLFSGKSTTTIVSSEKPEAGYAKLAQENRQVQAAPDNLAIVTRKKKGEKEVSYFVSGKDKNKGQKAPRSTVLLLLLPRCP